MQPRFAFFGTPYPARDTLVALKAAGFLPTVVVTSPDAPKGRGLALAKTPVREWAEATGIPVLTPARLDPAALQELSTYHCSHAVVVAYGKILPQEALDLFPGGALNVHYSLLPRWRGASPVESALLAGDSTTGVALQRMVHALDAGPLFASVETLIEPHETTRELRPRLVALGAELLAQTLPAFLAGSAHETPQDDTLATRAKKIRKEDGELTLAGGSDEENWRKYRAYAESPGTYFYAEKHGTRIRVKIREAVLLGDAFTPTVVVPEGRAALPYEEFLRSGVTPL